MWVSPAYPITLYKPIDGSALSVLGLGYLHRGRGDMATDEQLKLLSDWHTVRQQLKDIQHKERTLRSMVFTSFFPATLVGTMNIPLDDGFVLKAQRYQDYKIIDKDAVDEVVVKLGDVAPEGALIAQRLFVYEPKLVPSEYKQLPSSYRPLVDPIIEIKFQTPQLEITSEKKRGTK